MKVEIIGNSNDIDHYRANDMVDFTGTTYELTAIGNKRYIRAYNIAGDIILKIDLEEVILAPIKVDLTQHDREVNIIGTRDSPPDYEFRDKFQYNYSQIGALEDIQVEAEDFDSSTYTVYDVKPYSMLFHRSSEVNMPFYYDNEGIYKNFQSFYYPIYAAFSPFNCDVYGWIPFNNIDEQVVSYKGVDYKSTNYGSPIILTVSPDGTDMFINNVFPMYIQLNPYVFKITEDLTVYLERDVEIPLEHNRHYSIQDAYMLRVLYIMSVYGLALNNVFINAKWIWDKKNNIGYPLFPNMGPPSTDTSIVNLNRFEKDPIYLPPTTP